MKPEDKPHIPVRSSRRSTGRTVKNTSGPLINLYNHGVLDKCAFNLFREVRCRVVYPMGFGYAIVALDRRGLDDD